MIKGGGKKRVIYEGTKGKKGTVWRRKKKRRMTRGGIGGGKN